MGQDDILTRQFDTPIHLCREHRHHRATAASLIAIGASTEGSIEMEALQTAIDDLHNASRLGSVFTEDEIVVGQNIVLFDVNDQKPGDIMTVRFRIQEIGTIKVCVDLTVDGEYFSVTGQTIQAGGIDYVIRIITDGSETYLELAEAVPGEPDLVWNGNAILYHGGVCQLAMRIADGEEVFTTATINSIVRFHGRESRPD